MSKYTQPNWEHSILITIDTQNDFTLPNAPAEIKGTVDIVPKMRELLTAYRKIGLPILHVVRYYQEDGSNVDICRKEAVEKGYRIAVPNSQGAELVHDICPQKYTELDADILLSGKFQLIDEGEWVMYKPRWGAFYQTDLERFLREQGIDTLVFTGCNFPNCPRTSMYEASERDFRVVMIYDAMSQVYDKGVAELRNIGACVCKTSEAIEALAQIEG
ncbi:MAG TPA: cysteine hydrolase [Desulfitobacterium dehalogenans]|uniref:Cysteine hydrolase n=1 Tax=Desulfitobacterium dehalogenans TaxID=36854 RepID=A0A7C6Z6T7_9FIRM|nr:cysteine hydrolase [Desulfitobacterium dehalogenans]